MLCYHGSDFKVEHPLILKSQRMLDFGNGFYTTSSKNQAQKWALRKTSNADKEAYVNTYDFDFLSARSSLRIMEFKSADESWLKFVHGNRFGLEHDYDIVIGPVADDTVYKVLLLFENEIIDWELAVAKLKTEQLHDQILFHTEKSLDYITYLGSETVVDE